MRWVELGVLVVIALLLLGIFRQLSRLLGRLWKVENDAMRARIHAEHARDSAGRVMSNICGEREIGRRYWGDPPYLLTIPENKPPWYFDMPDQRRENTEEQEKIAQDKIWRINAGEIETIDEDRDRKAEAKVRSMLQTTAYLFSLSLEFAQEQEDSQWLYEVWNHFESAGETLYRYLHYRIFKREQVPTGTWH